MGCVLKTIDLKIICQLQLQQSKGQYISCKTLPRDIRQHVIGQPNYYIFPHTGIKTDIPAFRSEMYWWQSSGKTTTTPPVGGGVEKVRMVSKKAHLEYLAHITWMQKGQALGMLHSHLIEPLNSVK